MAIEAAEKSTKKVRVISVLDKGGLDCMKPQEKAELLPEKSRVVVAEAGVTGDWGLYVSRAEDLFTINRFGESGPGNEVAGHLGFSSDALAKLCDE
jgi:transketolase